MRSLSPELLDRLSNAHWPGNVRELESAVERLVVFGQHAELQPGDLARPPSEHAPVLSDGEDDPSIDTVIRRHVERVLEATGGHKAQAAKLLGVDLSTLYRWHRKWRR